MIDTSLADETSTNMEEGDKAGLEAMGDAATRAPSSVSQDSGVGQEEIKDDLGRPEGAIGLQGKP